MKKSVEKGESFQRIRHVIQADKSAMTEGCKALMIQDFSRLFEEYFDLNGTPTMDVVCANGIYDITVRFTADRVKKFNVLK
ncbi:MAG: hypothetical protein IIX01_02655 [Clostridia bacterium]|nr:hypothetical protein [Clostridia bacterium]